MVASKGAAVAVATIWEITTSKVVVVVEVAEALTTRIVRAISASSITFQVTTKTSLGLIMVAIWV